MYRNAPLTFHTAEHPQDLRLRRALLESAHDEDVQPMMVDPGAGTASAAAIGCVARLFLSSSQMSKLFLMSSSQSLSCVLVVLPHHVANKLQAVDVPV